ncbi:actin-domain-containing protein [Aspergillus indologenus CBS 114.80]|uniref:Actin-domain-containing protein n=1 Tax=Aspergillus indologenus CBS 114.80 TaxID=1450541 RepID=A0A2V5J492_9EURO|nr:actin-domain-containing protein [Aspergillus indologenus CBS 114.80]
MDDNQPLVIDVGSFHTKGGYSGDDAPRSVFPTVVSGNAVGEEAVSQGPAKVVQDGAVLDWDALTRVYRHVFYQELRDTPETHPILLSESVFTTSADRAKLVGIMFDEFSVPALEIIPDAVLAVYSAQRVSGVVVDVGGSDDAGTVRIVPVVEGKCLATHAVADVAFEDAATTLARVIHSADGANEHALASHVVLSGGAPTPDLANYLHRGLQNAGYQSVDVIDQPRDRVSVVWKGGALVAATADFASQ